MQKNSKYSASGINKTGRKSKASPEQTQWVERLRQEREAFDQQKLHDSQWFHLRLVMGYCAIGLLVLVAAVSSYILTSNMGFSSKVITGAGTTLLIEVLGLVISIWKIVLKPESMGKLTPVTQVQPQRGEQSKSVNTKSLSS